MQTAINTDVFIRQVLNTLVTQMEMWDELRRQKEVEAALYMNLMNKTILSESEERQLPAEYVDDTPRGGGDVPAVPEIGEENRCHYRELPWRT